MPKVSRESAEHVEDHGPVVDRHEDVDGYTINFVTFGTDIDAHAAAEGAARRQLPLPALGLRVQGPDDLPLRPTTRRVVEAGDAFYLPPGHIPVVEAGTEFVQFSPTEPLEEVSQTMARNFERMQGAGAPG